MRTRMTHAHLAALALTTMDRDRFGALAIRRDELGNVDVGTNPFGGTAWTLELANSTPRKEWGELSGATHAIRLTEYCVGKVILLSYSGAK